MEAVEKTFFKNSFGTVTDKIITLNYKNRTEDIPLGQITSISFKRKRNYFLSIPCFLIGAILLIVSFSKSDSFLDGQQIFFNIILVIIFFLAGAANWIGHYNIIISVDGKDRKPLKAEISKASSGKDFVNAVRITLAK